MMRLLQTLYNFIYEKPDYEILTVDEKTYTYSDIQKNIDKWKLVLERCGIKKRYKVVVYIKDIMDFVGIYLERGILTLQMILCRCFIRQEQRDFPNV